MHLDRRFDFGDMCYYYCLPSCLFLRAFHGPIQSPVHFKPFSEDIHPNFGLFIHSEYILEPKRYEKIAWWSLKVWYTNN